ncbi:MAG: carbohydrate ABC transporter permease [Limnochordaceae bacterium]|nr:carbohydrate ABC transporter permease [Limnochordaceae bacterium]
MSNSPAAEVGHRLWGGRPGFFPKGMLHVVLFTLGLLMVTPFVWMVLTALKSYSEIYVYPPRWLPAEPQWNNFAVAWRMAPFARFYFNSIVVTSLITASQLVFGALSAYAFARLEFPGREAMFVVFLGTLMIPIQVTMLPLFLVVKWLGWVNTYPGLIVPFAANAFVIFFLRQFFLTIPKELEDAATIDGCSRLRFLAQFLVPLSRPAFVTAGLFTGLAAWNEYVWPLIVTTTTDMRTLPVGLRYFISQTKSDFHYMMAASVIVIVPVILVFIALQRHFVEGVTMSGVKG